MSLAAPPTAEYDSVHETHESLLQLQKQLDEMLSGASAAERSSEMHLLELIRDLAKQADPTAINLAGHSCRVSRLAKRIAERINLPTLDVHRVAAAALFHDIGKIKIDGAIWIKPAGLNASEFELVKMHPIYGAEMMRSYAALAAIIPGIELHHEALDGSGYPYQLCEGSIPITARVTTVADAFDAMTSTREYQAAVGPDAALNTLRALAGVKFDRAAVAALCDVMQGCGNDAAPPLVYESVIARTA